MVTGSPWWWPAVNRPGDASQIKTSIMVTGSPWCVPPSGLHLLGLRCAGQQAGRCVPVSRPHSWSRWPAVNRPGGAGQCQGFDHGRANHSRRAVPARLRPQSWSRVRLGASVKASIMAGIRSGACQVNSRAMLASSRPRSWPGEPLTPGATCQRQDLDHGRVYLVALGLRCAGQRAGRCWPVSRLRSWPGEPLTPGATCQIKTSIMAGCTW